MSADQLTKTAKRTLWSALAVFLVFFLNVFLAGPLGMAAFLSDVQEMLVLFLAVVLFTAGTLALEARAKLQKSNNP